MKHNIETLNDDFVAVDGDLMSKLTVGDIAVIARAVDITPGELWEKLFPELGAE